MSNMPSVDVGQRLVRTHLQRGSFPNNDLRQAERRSASPTAPEEAPPFRGTLRQRRFDTGESAGADSLFLSLLFAFPRIDVEFGLLNSQRVSIFHHVHLFLSMCGFRHEHARQRHTCVLNQKPRCHKNAKKGRANDSRRREVCRAHAERASH